MTDSVAIPTAGTFIGASTVFFIYNGDKMLALSGIVIIAMLSAFASYVKLLDSNQE